MTTIDPPEGSPAAAAQKFTALFALACVAVGIDPPAYEEVPCPFYGAPKPNAVAVKYPGFAVFSFTPERDADTNPSDWIKRRTYVTMYKESAISGRDVIGDSVTHWLFQRDEDPSTVALECVRRLLDSRMIPPDSLERLAFHVSDRAPYSPPTLSLFLSISAHGPTMSNYIAGGIMEKAAAELRDALQNEREHPEEINVTAGGDAPPARTPPPFPLTAAGTLNTWSHEAAQSLEDLRLRFPVNSPVDFVGYNGQFTTGHVVRYDPPTKRQPHRFYVLVYAPEMEDYFRFYGGIGLVPLCDPAVAERFPIDRETIAYREAPETSTFGSTPPLNSAEKPVALDVLMQLTGIIGRDAENFVTENPATARIFIEQFQLFRAILSDSETAVQTARNAIYRARLDLSAVVKTAGFLCLLSPESSEESPVPPREWRPGEAPEKGVRFTDKEGGTWVFTGAGLPEDFKPEPNDLPVDGFGWERLDPAPGYVRAALTQLYEGVAPLLTLEQCGAVAGSLAETRDLLRQFYGAKYDTWADGNRRGPDDTPPSSSFRDSLPLGTKFPVGQRVGFYSDDAGTVMDSGVVIGVEHVSGHGEAVVVKPDIIPLAVNFQNGEGVVKIPQDVTPTSSGVILKFLHGRGLHVLPPKSDPDTKTVWIFESANPAPITVSRETFGPVHTYHALRRLFPVHSVVQITKFNEYYNGRRADVVGHCVAPEGYSCLVKPHGHDVVLEIGNGYGLELEPPAFLDTGVVPPEGYPERDVWLELVTRYRLNQPVWYAEATGDAATAPAQVVGYAYGVRRGWSVVVLPTGGSVAFNMPNGVGLTLTPPTIETPSIEDGGDPHASYLPDLDPANSTAARLLDSEEGKAIQAKYKAGEMDVATYKEAVSRLVQAGVVAAAAQVVAEEAGPGQIVPPASDWTVQEHASALENIRKSEEGIELYDRYNSGLIRHPQFEQELNEMVAGQIAADRMNARRDWVAGENQAASLRGEAQPPAMPIASLVGMNIPYVGDPPPTADGTWSAVVETLTAGLELPGNPEAETPPDRTEQNAAE